MDVTVANGFHTYNGGSLYWERAGDGSPVVLIHGTTLDTRTWDDQFSVLAKQHCVIRYDARGYGKSSPPSGRYSHFDDLAAIMDAHGIDCASLVGQSIGGGIAFNLALEHPARVGRLASIGGVVNGFPWSPAMAEVLERPRRTASLIGLEAAKEEWFGCPIFAPAREQPGVSARLQKMVNDYSGWGWLNDNPQIPLGHPAWSRLSELQMPILYILGERDAPDMHEIAARITAEAPRAQLLLVPSAGHVTNMEAAEIVNGALLKFFDTAAWVGLRVSPAAKEGNHDCNIV